MEIAPQKITPFLWFDNDAEEAAKFYTSIFKNSRIKHVTRYGSEGHEIHQRQEGSVMTIVFELDGMEFTGLNGGPMFQFTEAISFHITCDSQEEVDFYWERLSEGGDPSAQQCGWLKDKFGVSWQVIPSALSRMLSDSNATKAQRATKAMLQMKKIDVPTLERAFEGSL